MELSQIIQIVNVLGLPATLTAIAGGIGKYILNIHRSRSKETVLKWLNSNSSRDPFQDEPKTLIAINELHKELAIEKSFGVKIDPTKRRRLFEFAAAHRNLFDIRRIIATHSIMSTSDIKQNPKHIVIHSKIQMALFYIWLLGFCGYLLVTVYFPSPLTAAIMGTIKSDPVMAIPLFAIPSSIVYYNIMSSLEKSINYKILAKILDWESNQKITELQASATLEPEMRPTIPEQHKNNQNP